MVSEESIDVLSPVFLVDRLRGVFVRGRVGFGVGHLVNITNASSSSVGSVISTSTVPLDDEFSSMLLIEIDGGSCVGGCHGSSGDFLSIRSTDSSECNTSLASRSASSVVDIITTRDYHRQQLTISRDGNATTEQEKLRTKIKKNQSL